MKTSEWLLTGCSLVAFISWYWCGINRYYLANFEAPRVVKYVLVPIMLVLFVVGLVLVGLGI